jgi:hypothetical protein
VPARVKAGAVTRELLEACLAEHVERIDTDMALEYQVCVLFVGLCVIRGCG